METKNVNHLGSPANVTDDREACSLHWYVAQVQMNCELKCEKKIQALGVETFIPFQTEIHHWSDRDKKVKRLVIPMMIFVKFSETQVETIEHLSFVYKLLRMPGSNTPAKIPNNQIEQLKFMIGQNDAIVDFEPLTIKKGDEVQVIRGPLKGLNGTVCFCENNKMKIGILIKYLGYACMSINKTELEIVK